MMDIRTYLSQGKPLLFDGAMGTYYLPAQSHYPGAVQMFWKWKLY